MRDLEKELAEINERLIIAQQQTIQAQERYIEYLKNLIEKK